MFADDFQAKRKWFYPRITRIYTDTNPSGIRAYLRNPRLKSEFKYPALGRSSRLCVFVVKT